MFKPDKDPQAQLGLSDMPHTSMSVQAVQAGGELSNHDQGTMLSSELSHQWSPDYEQQLALLSTTTGYDAHATINFALDRLLLCLPDCYSKLELLKHLKEKIKDFDKEKESYSEMDFCEYKNDICDFLSFLFLGHLTEDLTEGVEETQKRIKGSVDLEYVFCHINDLALSDFEFRGLGKFDLQSPYQEVCRDIHIALLEILFQVVQNRSTLPEDAYNRIDKKIKELLKSLSAYKYKSETMCVECMPVASLAVFKEKVHDLVNILELQLRDKAQEKNSQIALLADSICREVDMLKVAEKSANQMQI